MEQYRFRPREQESALSVFTMRSSRLRTDAAEEGKTSTRTVIETQRNSISSNLRERETITQAILYTIAFIVTYMFPLLWAILNVMKLKKAEVVFSILTSIFYPLQGFWNFVFYIRQVVMHVRKNIFPDISILGAVWQVIWNATFVENSYSNNLARRGRGRGRGRPRGDHSRATTQQVYQGSENDNISLVGIQGDALGRINNACTAENYHRQRFKPNDCNDANDDDIISEEKLEEVGPSFQATTTSPLYLQDQTSDYITTNTGKDRKAFGSTDNLEKIIPSAHNSATVGLFPTDTSLNRIPAKNEENNDAIDNISKKSDDKDDADGNVDVLKNTTTFIDESNTTVRRRDRRESLVSLVSMISLPSSLDSN